MANQRFCLGTRGRWFGGLCDRCFEEGFLFLVLHNLDPARPLDDKLNGIFLGLSLIADNVYQRSRRKDVVRLRVVQFRLALRGGKKLAITGQGFY